MTGKIPFEKICLPRNNPIRAIEKLKTLQADYPEKIEEIKVLIVSLEKIINLVPKKKINKKKEWLNRKYEEAVNYSVANMREASNEDKISSVLNYFQKNKISLSPIEKGIIQKFKIKRYLTSKEAEIIENAIIYHKIDIVFMRNKDLLKSPLSIYQVQMNSICEKFLQKVTLAKK